MGLIKTTISIDEFLFEQIQELANQLRVSRSRLFATAMESFIERHRNRRLLEKINQAYRDEPDHSERKYLSRMKSSQRRRVDGQW